MSRSGGTLQYQLVHELVARRKLGRGIGMGTAIARGDGSVVNSGKWIVAKQEIAMLWALELLRRGADGFGIYRDPRDVAASLMGFRSRQREREVPFEEIAPELKQALQWQRDWERSGRVTFYRYEDTRADWAAMLLDIAWKLGVGLEREEAAEIVELYSLDNNLARMEAQDRWLDFGDGSMLTKAHISEARGEPGQWRDVLTDEDVAIVWQIAGGWMEERGYG